MKTHLAKPMVTSSSLLIHHGLSQRERGSGLFTHSGNGCGSLSWVLLTVILHNPGAKKLYSVSDGLFGLKGEAELVLARAWVRKQL